jgi:hypothetical protein
MKDSYVVNEIAAEGTTFKQLAVNPLYSPRRPSVLNTLLVIASIPVIETHALVSEQLSTLCLQYFLQTWRAPGDYTIFSVQ